jgi:hypothetical protein
MLKPWHPNKIARDAKNQEIPYEKRFTCFCIVADQLEFCSATRSTATQ